jgi:hypothetical protein
MGDGDRLRPTAGAFRTARSVDAVGDGSLPFTVPGHSTSPGDADTAARRRVLWRAVRVLGGDRAHPLHYELVTRGCDRGEKVAGRAPSPARAVVDGGVPPVPVGADPPNLDVAAPAGVLGRLVGMPDFNRPLPLGRDVRIARGHEGMAPVPPSLRRGRGASQVDHLRRFVIGAAAAAMTGAVLCSRGGSARSLPAIRRPGRPRWRRTPSRRRGSPGSRVPSPGGSGAARCHGRLAPSCGPARRRSPRSGSGEGR